MKKRLSILALGLAAALPGVALAEGAYVGLNAGQAHHKVSFDDGSMKSRETAYRLYAGYNFTPHFGVEGGYTHLGKFSDKWVDAPDFGEDSFKARALYAAATATLPLTEEFALFGKLGVAHVRAKGRFEENGALDRSMSKNKSNALLGAGARFKLTEAVSVVAEYEHYGKVKLDDIELKTNLASVGLRYTF